MSALFESSLEEFCPECGEWVSYLHFDESTGWCKSCVGEIAAATHAAQCRRCGRELSPGNGRTTCATCRQEVWLQKHIDELEFLVVVKHYSISQARAYIVKMVRPICRHCRKPIKGAHESALFHKGGKYRECHATYMKYARLRRKGLTQAAALRELDKAATMK